MNWLSRDHSGESTVPFCGSSDHCCVLKSKIFRCSRSSVDAALRYRPSGDQRGANKPADPGTVVTWWLSRSRMRIGIFENEAVELKTIWCPCGDKKRKVRPPNTLREKLARAAAL